MSGRGGVIALSPARERVEKQSQVPGRRVLNWKPASPKVPWRDAGGTEKVAAMREVRS
jgi:hypothetical protein